MGHGAGLLRVGEAGFVVSQVSLKVETLRQSLSKIMREGSVVPTGLKPR
jgi:hypothetical protein